MRVAGSGWSKSATVFGHGWHDLKGEVPVFRENSPERVLHRVTPEIGGGGTPIFQSNSSKGRGAAEVCNVNTLSSFLNYT
jgi:hypothetical protein